MEAKSSTILPLSPLYHSILVHRTFTLTLVVVGVVVKVWTCLILSYDRLRDHHFDTASCDNTSSVEVYSYCLVQLIMVEAMDLGINCFGVMLGHYVVRSIASNSGAA